MIWVSLTWPSYAGGRCRDSAITCIFYEPTDDGIEVFRVVHSARDYPRLFGR